MRARQTAAEQRLVSEALAITAMLLDDSYRLPPQAYVIQQTYDAARGELVPATVSPPLVN